MSSGRKCKNCGSSDIEVDPARGDAVCTNCGSVLEDNIIVSEIQYEEGAHGTSSAIGQFVAADSKGGAAKFGASFHVGSGLESRELTLKRARNGIAHLGNQLKLNQHCIDTACSFFKMALARNLTRGRRNTHIHAACVYLSCRTEGTAHLLIDISDVLQICCWELGRTYLKLSQALFINVPSVDPCLYILRFASKLEFGAKTQQVTNTALRMVQRMKRDSIHSGRRPSGLCGAALLLSARLHDYNRSIADIVKIVKVHESTMRKRLLEFGDTPSSTLTLDEFMTVDLEEEQDPPSFKVARKKDKERLQKLMEEDADGFSDLQKQIENQLAEQMKKRSGSSNKGLSKVEQTETKRFIQESTLGIIHQIMDEGVVVSEHAGPVGLGPDLESIGLPSSVDDTSNAFQPQNPEEENIEVDLEDLNDEEIDSYILSEKEFGEKNGVWLKMNEDYLKQQKEKEEQLQKEREEGKPEKKPRKRPAKRARMGPVSSAGEAIEKIIREKKISSKINYDVLKNLNTVTANDGDDDIVPSTSEPKKRKLSVITEESPVKKTTKTKSVGLPFVETKESNPTSKPEAKPKPESGKNENDEEAEEDEEDFYEEKPEETAKEMGVLQMLKQHHEDEIGGDEYGYDDYGYEEDY